MVSTKLEEARSALAAEWASQTPQTPEGITDFYRKSEFIVDDLHAWHDTEERKQWTAAIVYAAGKIEARTVVDIGCGAGHDLLALRDAGIPRLFGVEPNENLRNRLIRLFTIQEPTESWAVADDVAHAPIEDADLLVCIDVLEHIVDPETWLRGIAQRARAGGEKPGAVLIETTATHDIGTPLHLKENRGWHPGRVLEQNGFTLIDHTGRMRIWQRARSDAKITASVLLCAYRNVSVPTMNSVLALSGVASLAYEADTEGALPERNLAEGPGGGWRIFTKTGDGLVSRARSVVASRWWAETADDVFLMIDDDITFSVDEADRVIRHARERRGIVCGAYPVRNGAHLAIRGLDEAATIEFRPDAPLVEIEYAATGFMAVHRSVLDAMVASLELVHEDQPWAFWPMFTPMTVPMGPARAYLSEDWAFCHRARALGFKVYVDPTVRLGHLAQIQMNITNMQPIAKALGVPSV
jgi:SAM-dependent methyltransferase